MALYGRSVARTQPHSHHSWGGSTVWGRGTRVGRATKVSGSRASSSAKRPATGVRINGGMARKIVEIKQAKAELDISVALAVDTVWMTTGRD